MLRRRHPAAPARPGVPLPERARDLLVQLLERRTPKSGGAESWRRTEPETQLEDRLCLVPRTTAGRSLAEEFATADYREPWKYERVVGRLAVMYPDGYEHIGMAKPWRVRLTLYLAAHPQLVEDVVPNGWVRLDDGTDRIPDLSVYLVGAPDTPRIPDRTPELIFEIVSPGLDQPPPRLWRQAR